MRRLSTCVVLAVALWLAGTFASSGSAMAHDGDGRIEVLAAEPRPDGTVGYRLRVVFSADGHPAPESTVTATVVDPADPQAPQPLAKSAEEGVYEGEVRFPRPGPWTVRFTSLRPTASLERGEDVAAPTTTTTSTPPASTTTIAESTPSASSPRATKRGPSPEQILGGVVLVGALMLGLRTFWKTRDAG